MEWPRTFSLPIVAAGMMFLAGCLPGSYGPKTDASRFLGAKLTHSNLVVFSFEHVVYRRAQGIAAFPDGGISKYVTDINVLGVYDLKAKKARLIRRERNTDWQPGSGDYHVTLVNGPMALITQSGQLKGPFKLHTKHWLVDLLKGTMAPVRLKEDLAARGRALGAITMIDPRGALLFVCPSLAEHERERSWRRDPSIIPELWVRTPTGTYTRIAATRHYERVTAREVIYWIAATRQYKAYNLDTGKTRGIARYRHPPYKDVTEGASVGARGESLQIGRKTGMGWVYGLIPLSREEAKKLK